MDEVLSYEDGRDRDEGEQELGLGARHDLIYMKKWIKEKGGDAAHKAFQPGAAGYKRVFSEFDARFQ